MGTIGWMGDVNGPGCDPDVGPDDPNANTPGPAPPLHSLSLGPEPTTVDEWIEQSQRTGILEFLLLADIAKRTDDFLQAKGKECEAAWKEVRYWTDEAAKARREADSLRAEVKGAR
jgi:hypothetical protein